MSKLTDEQRQLKWREGNIRYTEAKTSATTEPLLQRIAELERQLEEARNQMDAQKDEWLSWEAKRKALEKDAERYRWLVAQMMHPDADHQQEMFNRLHAINPDPANAKEVDAAIDAAMQKGQS